MDFTHVRQKNCLVSITLPQVQRWEHIIKKSDFYADYPCIWGAILELENL